MSKENNLTTIGQIAYVFLVISAVLTGILLIPLAWQIPMIKHYKKNNGNVSIGFKICAILFCSLISGILMCCDAESKPNKK